jgi:putative DNA primase/helicase
MEPLPLPPSLLYLLETGEGEEKRKAAPPVEGRILDGSRDTDLTSLAGTMRRRGMTESEILAALTEVNKRCDPPKTAKDVARIAKSVARYEPGDPIGEQPSAETGQPDIGTLLKFGYEDEGNARTVAALHGDKLCHCEAYGWLRWNGRYWEREDAESILDGIILEVLKLRRAAAVKAEKEPIVKTAKPSAYRLRGTKVILKSLLTVSVSKFDAGHFHLNCLNGVVDLRTGEVTPHDPAQRFTYCTPVDYDPDASQTIWRDFLRDALGDGQELQDYVQEAVGYSCTGDTSEEVLFYVYGPTRGGKGCFAETIMAALGRRPLADEVDFTLFTAKRDGDTQNFDLAGLKPCRFIVASESSKYGQLNAAKVKQLTGGNEVRCAHKHRDFFTYRPQFKIWLVSNHPVNADVDDDAAWYRVRVIPFPHSWAGREDKGLKRRLREPGNLRGVLAWLVQGAMAWYSRGNKGLQTPDSVKVATRKARQELDFVGQWLDECIEVTGRPEDFMVNAAIYASYETWAKNNGVTPKKKRSLTTALKRKGLDAGQQKKVGGKNWRGCYGIRLAEVVGNEPEPLNF